MANNIEELQRHRDALLGEIVTVGDLRPGSLVKMTRRCGKPTCHCARAGDPGHPGWTLMRRVDGKTVTRGVPRAALQETRAQVAEHKRFKDLSRQFVEASEELCRARLKAGRDAGRIAKKGGSARRATR
ncbi:MAG: hypothetical protein OXP28_02495 [Gammaproteobacteria bacterium]|nr:hypothetical protein [Gammaproteobacteria bacterium]